MSATPLTQPVAPAQKPSSAQSSPPTSTSSAGRRVDQRGDPPRVARALLDGDDRVDLLEEPRDQVGAHVDAARLRVVVGHQRQPAGLGDRAVVGHDLARVAAVAERREHHQRAPRRPRRRRRRSAIAAAGVPADTPAITGTRPSTARDDRARRRRGARRVEQAARLAHRAGGDDAVHAGVEQRGDVALERGASIAPDASNGVVTAGMMPGKRMVRPFSRGSCTCARAGCAGRRRARRRPRRPRRSPRRSCGARRGGWWCGRGRRSSRRAAAATAARP